MEGGLFALWLAKTEVRIATCAVWQSRRSSGRAFYSSIEVMPEASSVSRLVIVTVCLKRAKEDRQHVDDCRETTQSAVL